MLRVAFGWATKAVFFGGQDFGPSIIEQILVRLKLQLKEICPRGNNKVLFISLYHDKCLLFMLELY